MPISNTYQPSAPTAKSGTGSAVSNREDLSNELSILAPEETPILSLCGKGKASATYSEWTVDSLAAPATTGISEGSDVTSFSDKFADRARLGNYIQLMRRDYIQSSAQSTNPVPTAYRTPSGSIITSSLSESSFNTMIGSIFAKNGEMNSLTLVANVALRQLISNFTRATPASAGVTYHVNQDATSKQITLSVNLYDSDFGLVKIVNGNPSCMPTGSTNVGYVLNPKYLGFNTLIPMGATRLENQGGGERGFIDVAGTLCVKHPQAHGKIAYS